MARRQCRPGPGPKAFPRRKSRKPDDASDDAVMVRGCRGQPHLWSSGPLSDKLLPHRVAGSRSEFAVGWAVLGITSFEVEASSGFGARERATCMALASGAFFERGQQGPADAAKPGIRRNVIERDLSGVGDATHPKDRLVLDSDEQGVARPYP